MSAGVSTEAVWAAVCDALSLSDEVRNGDGFARLHSVAHTVRFPGDASDLSVHAVTIEAPKQNLSPAAQDAFCGLMMLYTCRAFGDTMDSMTDEVRTDHYNHMLEGDYLTTTFALRPPPPSADETGADDSRHTLVALSHCALVRPDGEFPSSDACTVVRKPLYLYGIACDPLLHRQGMAAFTLRAAIHRFAPDVLCAKSQNFNIVRLLRSVGRGQLCFPVDTVVAGEPPGMPSADVVRSVALWMARHVRMLAPEADEQYDAEAMVFRKTYSPRMVGAFAGAEPSPLAAHLSAADGDGMFMCTFIAPA